jgi:hypothetical protein
MDTRAAALIEIGNLARLIAGGYLRAVGERNRERRLQTDDKHAYIAWSNCCDQFSQNLTTLAEAVRKHLPEIYTRLKLVGSYPRWHDRSDFDWDKAVEELRTIEAAADRPQEPGVGSPVEYLLSWREILDVLGMKNNTEERDKVRNLSDHYDGPILVPGRGSQPKVVKTKLLEWWNGLEIQWEVGHNRERDSKPTASDRYSYGKDGTVVPDIAGGVKRRRKDRKP